MRLSKIKIQNFKSFKDISIELNNFNVLIGACASGKSNFVEIFKFLKDLSEDFELAISKHGGDYYLKNFRYNNERYPCYINVNFINSSPHDFVLPLYRQKNESEDNIILMDVEKIEYDLKFNFERDNYEVLNEKVEFIGGFYGLDDKESKMKNLNKYISEHDANFNDALCITNDGKKINVKLEKNSKLLKLEEIIPSFLIQMTEHEFNIKNKDILLINSSLSPTIGPWTFLLNNIKFYDFHPKLCKSMGLIGSESSLTEQGDNLPVILDHILKNDEKRAIFLNLLNNLLPDINNIEVENIIEQRRMFNLVENYTDTIIPAPLVSDGTSDIIALIVALYFEKGELVLIEEPERNIHPALLSRLVQMMEDASNEKQIIITTHSPEVLRSANLEDIFLISRNSNGFSTISKPIDNKNVLPFIEELGIDEVYIDDYLELKNE